MDNNELQHWGIKGMRWGRRRYQNKDGSLTPAGRERYSEDDMADAYVQGRKDIKQEQKEARKQRVKTTLKIGAAAAATALAVIGMKKYAESKQQPMWKDGTTPLEKYAKKEGISIMDALKKTREANAKASSSSSPSSSKFSFKDTIFGRGASSASRSQTSSGKAAASAALKLIGSTRFADTRPSTAAYDRSKTAIKMDKDTEFYQSSLNGEDELQHWGIKGMRWGRRRYQNKDGSLTPAGRKRYGQDDLSPEERAEREAATKKAVMNSGDARKVLAYQSNLTNEELRKALDRVDLNSRLSKINADATKSGFDKAMSAIDTVDKVRSAGEKLVNTWNLIAGISNSLNKTSKLPQIDKGAKAFAESYIDQLKKNGSAEQIMEQIKLGNVKTSDLNDFANIMRNRETINSYTAAAQAAKQKEEKAKAAEEAAKKAREAAKSNAEVKAAEAKAAQAAANARKAEAEAAAAEAKLKDKLNNNGK